MSNLNWYRDEKNENIIVMIDDIEITRFPFGSFAESFESLDNNACLQDKLMEIFADEPLELTLQYADLA